MFEFWEGVNRSSVLLCPTQFQLTSLNRTVKYHLSFNMNFRFNDVTSMKHVSNFSF
jgi:hypothetical protein